MRTMVGSHAVLPATYQYSLRYSNKIKFSFVTYRIVSCLGLSVLLPLITFSCPSRVLSMRSSSETNQISFNTTKSTLWKGPSYVQKVFHQEIQTHLKALGVW